MSTIQAGPRELTREEYELFRKLIYAKSGINLGDQKMQLVRARLGKRLRTGDFASYRAYYEYVRKDQSGRELCELIDAISTNTTHLFREMQHFDFLAEVLRGWAGETRARLARRVIRIWSAGCSSGEEPHSIAMVVHDALKDAPSTECKILATDISTRVLDRAQAGIYDTLRLGTVPKNYRHRYFVAAPSERGAQRVQIAPQVRQLIRFARFNLMTEKFPFKNQFDVIFCRNVMIYFDRPTQEKLVNKYAAQLSPGGYLLIGHSESLNALQHPLVYVRPTIYKRPEA